METVNNAVDQVSGVPAYVRKKGVDSANVDIVGQEQDIYDFLNPRGHTLDTDPVLRSEEIEKIAFMNHEVTVYLQEPQTEWETDIVEVNVGGDYRRGIRGQEMTMKRYHLAVLARAKISRVRQTREVAKDGSMSFVEKNVVSLAYPFQVISDPDPKRGGPWLRQLLSNNV